VAFLERERKTRVPGGHPWRRPTPRAVLLSLIREALVTIDYRLDLSPEHAELLAASAISVEVAQARGYRTVRTKGELRALDFAPSQCCVPGLLIPVWGVTKQIVTHQFRPDQPRRKGGKPLKYETPAGSRMALDVPRPALEWLGDPTRPLVVTEGARKADAAISLGLCCVALLGVWNFRGTNAQGGKVALGDWEHVASNGREVYIAFDSDVTTKAPVQDALRRLKAFLESRGALVRVITCRPDPAGRRRGSTITARAAGPSRASSGWRR
jgi:Domain of unknown function (DUF3854)